jgi:hypothetical protein
LHEVNALEQQAIEYGIFLNLPNAGVQHKGRFGKIYSGVK